MKTEQRGKMTSYLDQLLESTRANQINWSEANPTTYVWDSNINGGRLILQQLALTPFLSDQKKLEFRHNYIMQVLDAKGSQQLIIQGHEDVEINLKLKSLFDEIKYVKTQNAIDFLGSLLPSK